MLFNFHRATASGDAGVVVVEGFLDCLKVYQAGIRSVVALIGSALSECQLGLAGGFPQVFLMLDGDEAGRRAAGVIAAQLVPRCALRLIELAPGMQPDQLPPAAIHEPLGAR